MRCYCYPYWHWDHPPADSCILVFHERKQCIKKPKGRNFLKHPLVTPNEESDPTLTCSPVWNAILQSLVLAVVADVAAACWFGNQCFQEHCQYLQARMSTTWQKWGMMSMYTLEVHQKFLATGVIALAFTRFSLGITLNSIFSNIQNSHEYKYTHGWQLPLEHSFFSRKWNTSREKEKEFRDLGPQWEMETEYMKHLTSVIGIFRY